MALRWYIVHTYSGFENKVRLHLLETVKQQGLEEKITDVLVAAQEEVQVVKGVKRHIKQKFFPSYVFVRMDLDDEDRDRIWHLVKDTPRVTGFLGGHKPTPVPDSDVERIQGQMAEGTMKPKVKIDIEEGENVKVIEGPFANFNGVVEEVNQEKGKVRVLVSIFGRSTPVELDFTQVQRTV
jgi:transcription termination/antitermination protein NusG